MNYNKNAKIKIFFDTEFTGLHKDTTLISIGLVSECGKRFYAELTDYDSTQIDEYLENNILSKRSLQHMVPNTKIGGDTHVVCLCDMATLKVYLSEWFAQFSEVEMISDCLHYDWVLFISIFGTAFDIPKNVYYIPFDICTMLFDKGYDPDTSREDFAGMKDGALKHNALWDALVIEGCYKILKCK